MLCYEAQTYIFDADMILYRHNHTSICKKQDTGTAWMWLFKYIRPSAYGMYALSLCTHIALSQLFGIHNSSTITATNHSASSIQMLFQASHNLRPVQNINTSSQFTCSLIPILILQASFLVHPLRHILKFALILCLLAFVIASLRKQQRI